MAKSPKDQDEAKLETLAKRLLATPPKPRETSGKQKSERARKKAKHKPSGGEA